MPASDYTYDPGAALAANKLTAETYQVDPSVDRSVWPIHGPFFASSDLFAVRGRNTVGSGSYANLRPNLDYTFSPQFTKASAASGRMVATYIVLINTNIREVEIDYHALGEHEDDILNGWFANNSIDRSNLLEWLAVVGDTAGTNPLTRHGELRELSKTEVLLRGLEMLRDAIGNPTSSEIITSADVTRIQMALSSAASIDDVNDSYKNTTKLAANSGDQVVLHTMEADSSLSIVSVSFKNDAGDKTMYQTVNLYATDTTQGTSLSGSFNVGGTLFTVSARRIGSNVQLVGVPIESGTFSAKTLVEHLG